MIKKKKKHVGVISPSKALNRTATKYGQLVAYYLAVLSTDISAQLIFHNIIAAGNLP